MKRGINDIINPKRGTTDINKIYRGTNLIWGRVPTNPFQDASIALSLRDLGLGATNVVRVRRDSDNTEQDFTATEITDGTLTSFCGAGNGFVSIWYNQAGVNDASQSIASNQPKIVNAGALILEGSKPIIQAINGETNLVFSGYSPNSGVKQIFTVNQSPDVSIILGGAGSPSSFLLTSKNSDTNTNLGSDTVFSNLRKNSLSANPLNRGDVYNLFNPQNIMSFNADFSFIGDLLIGYTRDTWLMYNMQEFILFDTNQNVNTIETNMNNYYNIY